MKSLPKNHDPLLSDRPYSFINLKDKTFAEYYITYRINDCYSIDKLSQIRHPDQILFQKFNSKQHQRNLLIVDSTFPLILADLAIYILTDEVACFEDYIKADRFLIAVNPQYDKKYYRHKFKTFIFYLLFTNIASGNICKGEIEADKVYCQKNDAGQLQFYSGFRLIELQKMMLTKMKLEINLKASTISNHKTTLNLRIFLP